ncbi:alpha/beta hydrolase [Pseudoalteromonas ruthenica]|uniref:Alpha/beta hydrolase n=1 Tax=Pseudoalteromonas ruthenica TaxID=151081 RepID=A0A5S3Z3P8_9GAMM|nr:alpha/beta fold hydrolase [Pseudoalteromonas ruthenica]TMP86651.1 alpha/beta hydrolase [Pseudoalteromonas ruthenica]
MKRFTHCLLGLLLICTSAQLYAGSRDYPTVKIGAYDVEYEIAGSGDVTLLLEAGGSAGLDDWQPIFYALAGHARVIRYSRVGNGGSSAVKKHYSSEQYAQEALALLQALAITEPVVYIAHSYGAYIARTFAARYPGKIAALMLIDPASEHDVDIMRQIDLATAERQIAQVKRDDMKNGMSNQYLDFWSKRPLPDYPDIPDIPVTVIASVKTYEEPSLLLFTDQGRAMWGDLHSQWAQAFPQGEAILTDKSYHFIHHEQPQWVVEHIQTLIKRVRTK